MIAEDIIKKIEKDRSVELSKIEAGWLTSLLKRVMEAQRSNEKYYRVNESAVKRRDRWNLKDMQYLKEAYESGETDAQIAKKLGRTTKGVERKRHIMGIRRPEYRKEE